MLWSCGLKKKKHSQWYKDTPKRCQKMSDAMRYGSFEKEEPRPGEAPSWSEVSNAQLLAEIKRRMEQA